MSTVTFNIKCSSVYCMSANALPLEKVLDFKEVGIKGMLAA
jgi:hypothetical protein